MTDLANVFQISRQVLSERVSRVEMEAALKFGGGSGTTIDMDALVDAKIAAAEARTDAKFAQVLAKLDTLTTEVRTSRSSIWTAAFAIMGLILAVVAMVVTVAPSAFSVGAQMREVARDEARAAATPLPVAPVSAPAAVEPTAK